MGAGLQPMTQFIGVALTGFAEQPAHGLLYKIVLVIEKYLSYCVCIGRLSVTDELHGAYHSYSLLPDGLSVAGQIIEQATVFVKQYRAQNEAYKVSTGKISC